MAKPFVSPYHPNGAPEIKSQMLDFLGFASVSDIYRQIIPEGLLLKQPLELPEAIRTEYDLKRHVMGILNKNRTTEEFVSFLGAGCYKHQIPAVCDELMMRGEFLTGYCGDTYSDHGKMQAIFEYTSLLGELLDADAVSYTTYDGGQAVSSTFRMALRISAARGTNRTTILVPWEMSPEILSQAQAYCEGFGSIVKVRSDPVTHRMDLKDLTEKLRNESVAAVFYENPAYLGFFEENARAIADLAHAAGALCLAQTEAAALGVMESPLNLGADLVCGDIQSLGMHMQYGGGQAGFIACAQDTELLEAFPTYMYGICETERPGVFGYGRAMNYRCSHGSREKANEFFGTATGLWCITAAVYLASMGPEGMRELGQSILANTRWACEELATIPGIDVNPGGGCNFQEFIVDFSHTGRSVADINRKLLAKGIFGGKDLSRDFPHLGQSALYCCSELTTNENIQLLKNSLRKILEAS